MLRYKADRKSVIYMLIATSLMAAGWLLPFGSAASIAVFVGMMIMAIPTAVIAHNHNHVRTWESKGMNLLTDYWITIFYGFPAFAWIPTHNKNHHKHNNTEGDDTLTWRYSEKNNLLTLVSYPAISSWFQQFAIKDYLKLMKDRLPSRFWFYVSQYALIIAFVGGALLLDWRKAIMFVIIPQQFALFSILCINYIQHVHADEQSEYDHSRNFVGPVLNWYLLNNGYHTVHHESPGIHWSNLPEAHAEIADEIHDDLNVENFATWFADAYLLSPFSDRFGTESMRLKRKRGER